MTVITRGPTWKQRDRTKFNYVITPDNEARHTAKLKSPVLPKGFKLKQGYAVLMVDPSQQLPSIQAQITFVKRTKYRIQGVLNGSRISLGYKQLALLATGRQAGVAANDHVWLVTIIERTPDIATHLASVERVHHA